MLDHTFPVLWTRSQAVVTLPDYIDVTAAGQVREQLLAVLNRGADPLVVDMAATVSCDQAGADAIARAYQRAHVSGAQLRLVVATPVVRRVLSLSGIDRLVSIYPSLDTALAAGGPGAGPASAAGLAMALAADQPFRGSDAGTQSWPGPGGVLTAAVLRQVVDALADGVLHTAQQNASSTITSLLQGLGFVQHFPQPRHRDLHDASSSVIGPQRPSRTFFSRWRMPRSRSGSPARSRKPRRRQNSIASGEESTPLTSPSEPNSSMLRPVPQPISSTEAPGLIGNDSSSRSRPSR